MRGADTERIGSRPRAGRRRTVDHHDVVRTSADHQGDRATDHDDTTGADDRGDHLAEQIRHHIAHDNDIPTAG
ncbi:hypothetical protein GCM10025762_11950 [Haloechinothrix salitolerans]